MWYVKGVVTILGSPWSWLEFYVGDSVTVGVMILSWLGLVLRLEIICVLGKKIIIYIKKSLALSHSLTHTQSYVRHGQHLTCWLSEGKPLAVWDANITFFFFFSLLSAAVELVRKVVELFCYNDRLFTLPFKGLLFVKRVELPRA